MGLGGKVEGVWDGHCTLYENWKENAQYNFENALENLQYYQDEVLSQIDLSKNTSAIQFKIS